MKLNIIKGFVIALPLMGLASCMDFDTPSDEFTGGTVVLDPTIYKGNADNIDYHKAISEEGFDEANEALKTYYAQLKTAQYYLRGGKDGVPPQEHQYQFVYNLHLDNYAGYTTADQNFDGRMETTYSYLQNFCDGPFGAFLSMKNNLANLMNIPAVDSIPEIKAMALLLFNYSAQEVTDIYGTIPYADHKNNKESNPFEYIKGVDIYATIIDNIDTIVACFDSFHNRPDWYKQKVNSIVSQWDAITLDKSLDSWKRMANSIKLRMAMHVVKLMPEKAQKWAEEAVASGVVENLNQEILLDERTNYFETHPLYVIANSWNDTRLNASFESMLNSLDHPFLKYVFKDNSNEMVNEATGAVMATGTRVVGLRAGIRMMSGQQYYANPRVAYSQFDEEYLGWAPVYYIKLAEMEFLRAEGALRGWNMGGGTAKSFYEDGIRHAQVEAKASGTQKYTSMVDDYMKLENAKAYTYVDPMDDSNNHESVTTIGVKWNDADDQETKLEKIITQKYIALFPYSNEAWTEMRRTGYPKIFPVLNPDMGDGSLSYGDLIRRIPLPGRDTSVGLDDINTTGITALDGPDLQATRVFWDLETSNF